MRAVLKGPCEGPVRGVFGAYVNIAHANMAHGKRALTLLLLLLCAAHARTALAQETSPTPRPTPGLPSAPLSYGLVVDNSGSLRAYIDQVIAAGKTLVEGQREGDEAFVLRFVSRDQIELVRDFTGSRAALGRTLDAMYVEGGQTAVVDAVYMAAEHLSQKYGPDSTRQRALVLITDGEDRASYYTKEQLLALLRERRITVHVLGFPRLARAQGQKSYEQALALIKTLAEETGGRAVVVEEMTELPSAASELLKHLHR